MTGKMKPSGVAWIGDIPEGWEMSRVKYHYEISLGKMLQPLPLALTDTLEYYMCSANITWNGISLTPLKQMWFNASEKAQYKLRKGDLLVTEGGDVAVSCIWNGEVEDCYLQNAAHRVRQIGAADNRFLYYWLFLCKHTGYIDQICNKATIAHFTKEKFGEIPLCVMRISEQKAIADFLDVQCAKIDSVIADIEKQIETLQKYKKSMITEAVTKGLDRSVPMKNSGMKNVDDIPQGWSVQRLKYVSRLKTGTTPAGNEGINYEGQGIPWFTPSDFVPSLELKKSEKFVDDETINREGITPYPANSVLLVAIGATVGKIGITKSKGYSNQQITAIIPTGIDSKYLLYYLFSKADYIKDNALYTTLPIINNAYLSNIPVIIPSEQEQKDIAEYLDRRCSLISKIICDKEKQLKTVQQHKKSLIYEYVTGKKRATEVN